VAGELGHWGDIRASFEKAYQGAPDAECGHSARFARIAKTQRRHRGRARSAAAHRCSCHPRAARAGATPWVPPLGRAYIAGCWPKLDTVLTSGRQVVFCGLESSPSSTASSAWRHAATAAEARPSPTAERNVAVRGARRRKDIMHYNFTHATEGDVYGADQQRRARVCRIALDEPVTPRRGAWSAGAGSSFLYVVLVCRTRTEYAV